MKRIENYSFGKINVDGQSYKQDLIIFPERVQADWWRKEGHMLQLEDIAGILADPPDALVIGQGEPGKMQMDASVVEELQRLNVELVAAPTKVACSRFNELSQKGMRVVAALHLTC
jgi:hypothetical protein